MKEMNMASNPNIASNRKMTSNPTAATKAASKPKTASNPVRWFEIYVQDMKRARAFYEAVFQLKLEKLDNPANPEMDFWRFAQMIMDQPGTTGALVKMEGVEPGGNSTIVYFACEDCAVEAARAEKAGGRVHMGKTSIGQYGAIALVFDSEGNMIGLHSMS
jgi:predicted enzyme related to lactoylglutathione lyase